MAVDQCELSYEHNIELVVQKIICNDITCHIVCLILEICVLKFFLTAVSNRDLVFLFMLCSVCISNKRC